MATPQPFVWGAGGARMTPEEIAAERKVAAALMQQGMDYSPIRHWTQGAARVAQAMMGGLDHRRADEASKANAAADRDMLTSLLGGGASAAPAAQAPEVGPLAAATAGKVYTNDEPSPLDPPSGADRDMAIRTVLAEAGNQPQIGKEAVANVIRNRAVNGNFGGDTLPGVIQKPMQFEPWNTQQGRARMAAIDPNSQAYAAAGQAVDAAYSGAPDPTRGATHFFSPKAQAALGRPAPAWGNGQGTDIGDHRFFGGAGGPAVTAGMSPSDVSAQSRPNAGSSPAMPQAAAPANPMTGINPAIIQAMTSPYASDSTKKVAALLLQQQLQQQNQASDPMRQLQMEKLRAETAKLTGRGPQGPVERGLAPQFGVDANGNPVLLQLGKDGTAVQTRMPEGVTLSKEPIKLDAGTHFVLLDPITRQPVGTVQKNVAAVESQKVQGEAEGKAVVAAPNDYQTGQNALDLLDKIEKHPGLSKGTGIWSYMNKIPGTDGYDFNNIVEQAKSGAFLSAIQQMRGMGSLSNAEGAAATAAVTRMDTATSKEAFIEAMNDYRKIVKQGMERARSKMGAGAQSAQPSAAPSVDDLVKKYGGV